MEAHRVRARHRRRAEAAREQAEGAGVQVAAKGRRGVDARGPARPARVARRRATTPFERVERSETAWGRIDAAWGLFRAAGRLNDRALARAEIAAARVDLPGADRAKVGNSPSGPRSPALLDRMHCRLGVGRAATGPA